MLRKLFSRRLVALITVASVCASSTAYGSKNTKTYGPDSFAWGRVQELKMVTTWTGYTGPTWVINPSTDPSVPMTRFMITVPAPMPGGPTYAYVVHEHIFVTTFASAAAITGANTFGQTQQSGGSNVLWDPSTIVP